MSLLAEAAIFLTAAVVTVPLFRRLKLGAVLGYLTAGVIIGPWALRLVTDVDNLLHFAELGVVLLLFVIGLELQPSRLWVLRKTVFGLGGAQVAVTGLVIAAIGLALGQSWQSALVMGLGLAMSSTAFVLQVLAERKQLTMRHGRSAFAILLFQDLTVIPLLALIPLLSMAPTMPRSSDPWLAAAEAVAVIVGVIVGGRLLLRPILRAIADSGIQEIFTAAALLVVLGVSLLMVGVGLSMSLGAFLAGVLLADSEYRHELEANIEPFKGLLLGLFFISVGMAADLGLIVEHPLLVPICVAALMATKAAILYALGRLSGHSTASSRALAVALCQGGEFAFVLFALAERSQVMDRNLVDLLVVVVTLSMAATPLVLAAGDLIGRNLRSREPAPAFDAIEAEDEPPVIIAGFGRVGQIVGRILLARGIRITALDVDPAQVESVRRFGSKVSYGDASRLELLQAAGAGTAKVFVLAVDNVEKSLVIAETLRRHYPHLKIFARARNRFHAYRLMDSGVDYIIRETLLSSLDMAGEVLQALGTPGWQAREVVERFRAYDQRLLTSQHAVYHDETALQQASRDALRELDGLLRGDREAAGTDAAGQAVFSPSDIR
jgi:glutathione-regulated potassium-efflux system ancillary protein KefC/glutathione-regulated potassium-efflux system protein KefB